MTSLLLTGATIITVDPQRRILPDGAVLVQDDRIAAVGPSSEVTAADPSTRVLDCSGRVVIPGLVNTHTHLFQTLLKGLGDDMVLKDWFTCMTGPSAAELTVDDVYAAARHGAAEAVRSGTTTLVDFMYVHPRPGLTAAVIDALEGIGIRGVVGRGFITTGTENGVPARLVEDIDHSLNDAADLIGRQNRDDALVRVGLAPTMIWTVDEPALRATRALADDTGALVMMHVSETPFEIQNSLDRFGCRDTELLARIGFLGPDVLAVHCVQCTDTDVQLLAEHRVGVSHNPCSNLYLASGFAPIPQMVRAGIAVGLGSDGPASSNNHSMIQAMKFAALMHKGYTRDATIVTAEQVLEMATLGGARALGLADQIGSIEVGKKADLVVLAMDNLAVTPMHNPVSALVYSALGSEPETVIVDGHVVLEQGRLQTGDETEIRNASTTAARALAARAGTAHLATRRWR